MFAGISVSSLSDGVFVLHVPSEDNKQKVKMRTPNCFAAVLKKEKKSPTEKTNLRLPVFPRREMWFCRVTM